MAAAVTSLRNKVLLVLVVGAAAVAAWYFQG